MASLSFNGKRLIAGIALVVFAFCVANYYLEFFTVRFKKPILGAGFIIAALAIRFFGPSMQEIQDYRARKNAE